MTTAEREQLWEPVIDKFYGILPRSNVPYEVWLDASKHLEGLLNTKEFTIWMNVPPRHETPMSEELKQKLEMLMGPHGEVIYKAFKHVRDGKK